MFWKVKKGQALIRSGIGGDLVSFKWAWVLPIFHRASVLDLSARKVTIDLTGKRSILCKDYLKADLILTFNLRVGATPEDVLQVHQIYQYLAVEKATDRNTLVTLFEAKFVQALKTIAKDREFKEIVDSPESFCEQVMEMIGTDLNGFVLESLMIEHLEQTPLEFFDPTNILDAEGIKKITTEQYERQALENALRRKKELEEARAKAQEN